MMKSIKLFSALFLTILFFSACKKEYSIENGVVKTSIGTWQFSDSDTTYTGDMDSVSIVSTGTTKELFLDGKTADGSQNFSMVLFADTFKVGSYKASLFQTTFDFGTASKTIYKALQLNGEFIVNITSLTNSSITGDFSGKVLDSLGRLVNLTNGKFTSKFSGIVAPTSSGVLGDSAGNCRPAVINGVYKEGTTMTPANTAQIQVTVAVPGTYSISTNSVNGIMFSSTGTFNSTGVQSVTLTASGTPALSGDQTFTLNYGNSKCGFKLTFLPAAAASGDYFPLSLNTNWQFSLQGGTTSDSTFSKVIDYKPTFDNKDYQTIARYDVPNFNNAIDSFYYRKPGGDYYQFMNYSTLLGFDNIVTGEFIFLKDNVAAGTTWNSPTISGTILGVPISGYAKMTILEKAVPVTIASFDFPDVIKVKYEYFLLNAPVPAYTMERWFAKNIGEIYNSFTMGPETEIHQIEEFRIY